MAISDLFKQVWAKEMEVTFKKENQSEIFADMSFNSALRSGNTLHRQYGSIDPNAAPGVHTRGLDIAETTYDATDEIMTINREFSTLFYVEIGNEIQSDIGIASYYGEQFGAQMKVQIDSDVFAEALNAGSVVDAGTLGGTAGQGITITTANILNTLTAVRKKLKKLNVSVDNIKGGVPPEFIEFLTLYMAQKNTNLGDTATQRGYYGDVSGIKIYETNNLTGSAVLFLNTAPTAGETVGVAGQVFTFVAALTGVAGQVLINVSAAVSRANLAALISAPAVTTANGVAIGTATSQVVKNFIARVSVVNNNTANTLTVTQRAVGTIVVSETLSAAADIWTPALVKQHCLFVSDKGPALVVQQTPTVDTIRHPSRYGYNTQMYCLYGLKTFADQAKKMVRVEINSSVF